MINYKLQSPEFLGDQAAPWLIDVNRGRKALELAKARRHLLDFTQYTSQEYNVNWHHKIICNYLERWAFGQGNKAIKRLMIFLPPGSGKALEVNTLIPVPIGFKRIVDLQIGDELFDENGNICHIIDKTPILKNRPVYSVIMDTGESILADKDHEWMVKLGFRGKYVIHTTEYLAKRTSSPAAAIPLSKPLVLSDIPLDIDPYVLGVWLGDGDSEGPTISQSPEDMIFLRSEIERRGYKTSNRNRTTKFYILNVKHIFRKNNLLYNKHIPEPYFRASAKQRLSLLQGLMDTDGTVSKNGFCIFSNTNILLAEGVRDLVATLGFKASLKTYHSLYNNTNYIIYKVYFVMKNSFLLPRKLNRTIEPKKKNHYIHIEYMGKMNTICIQVDSPSGMFLCGKSMIPTHNSELVSRRLPAWIFGNNPDVGIMATSYASSLVEDMNIDVQRIMDTDAYKEVFPGVSLSDHNSRNSLVGSNASRNRNTFEIVGRRGYYKCAGVGGSITGKRFFYGIIDDPLRGRQDAESKTIRDKTYNWYINDFYTRRLNQDARILITLTRWHEDDLAGRLLSLASSNPKAEQWTVIKFPMIAEDPLEQDDPRQVGESLWPWRYGTTADLESVKISSGTYTWSSLYQQRPAPSGGSIFNRGWWGEPTAIAPNRNQFYTTNPLNLQDLMDVVILSVDCTFKDTDGTDYVVIQVWGKKGGDFYLLDQKRDRMDIIVTMQTIQTILGKWPKVTAKLIEDKANGSGIITMLKREIPGLIPVNPQGGKVVRAQAITPYIESGNVWLPSPKYANWLHDLIEEISAFPTAQHDDQVDALTQALFYLGTRPNISIPKLPKKAIRVGGGWV